MSEFAGKVVVVTGAGSGIGRAIACEFASAGAIVVLAGRREEALHETLAAIERRGGEARAQVADVTDERSVQALIDFASQCTGHIDVLVNNAGITAVTEPLPEHLAQNLAVIETNLHGVMRVISLALPKMKGGGRIINVASVLSLRAAARSAAYAASKHGLIGLTKSLALDLAPRGITINAICPGWVDTDMARDVIESLAKHHDMSPKDMTQRIVDNIPMGRMVEPEEVAHVALFLAGDKAGVMTGQAITICGGSSLV